MTLLLLLFGTISTYSSFTHVAFIVRYKNGTVGVKNDGGTVKVQSTDLIVDGNLSVSGSLFVQDRDLAEYEERVSFRDSSPSLTPIPRVCALVERVCFTTERVGFASACRIQRMFITVRVVRIRAYKMRHKSGTPRRRAVKKE